MSIDTVLVTGATGRIGPTVDCPTATLLDEVYPGVDSKAAFEGYESLVSTEKATDLLGWRAL